MTLEQWGIVIAFGATVMLVNLFIKFLIYDHLKMGDANNEIEIEAEDDDNDDQVRINKID